MARIKLTAAAVDKLKAPASGRSEYFDASFPGFGVRVTDKGKKSWIVFYRLHGRQRRLTLGSYPAVTLATARKLASDALEKVEAGVDPAEEKAAAKAKRPDTFENVVADFIEKHHKRRNKGWKPVEQLFANHVTPKWKGRDIRSIERRDVIRLLDDMQARGYTTQANRVLAHVRKLFNWCLERELVQASPVAGVKLPQREEQRERVLSADELRDLWQTFGEAGYPFGPMFRLSLLTAQRRGEIANMRWRDVDLDAGLWTIPETKSGRAHEVPLSRQAVTLLREVPTWTHGDYVWSTTDGKSPVSGYSKAKLRVERDTNARREKEGREPMENWRLHDLRRTAATGMAHIGVSVNVISRVLNHAQTSVTAVYDRHSYLSAKRQALQAWADALDRVLAGKPMDATGEANVVKLAEAG
jgi:integrase